MRLTGVQVPHNYEEQFGKAILTFNHQRVFDPVAGEIVHLREVPKDVVLDLDFVGPYPLLSSAAMSFSRFNSRRLALYNLTTSHIHFSDVSKVNS